jgi:hypothetical protein
MAMLTKRAFLRMMAAIGKQQAGIPKSGTETVFHPAEFAIR